MNTPLHPLLLVAAMAVLSSRSRTQAPPPAPVPEVSIVTVGDAFRVDLIVIASILRDAVGRQADPNSLCLAALTILSQCVFLCAARTTLPRIFPQINRDALRPETLMAYLAQSSLRGLSNGAHPSVPNTAPIHIRIPLPAPPTRKTAAVHQGSRP